MPDQLGTVIRSVGADLNKAETVFQFDGHTMNKSTLKALGLTEEQGKNAIEVFRKTDGLKDDFRGKIMGNGDVVHPHTEWLDWEFIRLFTIKY